MAVVGAIALPKLNKNLAHSRPIVCAKKPPAIALEFDLECGRSQARMNRAIAIPKTAFTRDSGFRPLQN